MLNKKDIISKVLADTDIQNISKSEIETRLNAELSKDEDEIDFDLVSELSLSLIEANGGDEVDIDVNKKIDEIRQSAKPKRIRIPKPLIGLAAACFLILCGNIYSASAYNMNLFSFFVEYMDGAVKFNFSKPSEIVLPTTPDDPYGIRAKCKEIGIENIEVPTYLPDGFILTTINHKDDEMMNSIQFVYQGKGKKCISITFDEFYENILWDTGIPSDKHNISEIEICGHKGIMSKEENQMNSLWQYNRVQVDIFTQDISYDECDKILASYK